MDQHADILKVQINDYDTYQAQPSRLDDHYATATQVPITRIFGAITIPGHAIQDNSKEEGQASKLTYNVLVHVHNYFPYLFVDCLQRDPTQVKSTQYVAKLVDYLETCLHESYQRRKARNADSDEDLDDEEPQHFENDDEAQKRKYIADVNICKATPMYGFHVGYQLLFKVSFLSPNYKTRFTKLVHDNTLDFETLGQPDPEVSAAAKTRKKRKPRPLIYESHIPISLQFLTDFNLYGCGWLELSRCYFRSPVINRDIPSAQNLSSLKSFLQPFINSKNVLNPKVHSRIGRSLIEIDIHTSDIVNRQHVSARDIHHDFTQLTSQMASSSSLSAQNNEIQISSLEHVHQDLLYQCQIKNASQSLLNSQRGYNTKLGKGSTAWPNQSELDDLLAYVIKLNKTSTTHDPQLYYDRNLKETTSITNDFPTCFDLVDRQRHHAGQVAKISIRSGDLYHWRNYEELFEAISSENEVGMSRSPLIQPKGSDSTNGPIRANKLSSLLRISFNSDFSDSDISEVDEEEDEATAVKPQQGVNGDDGGSNSDVESTTGLDDNILLELTQRKRKRSQSLLDSPPRTHAPRLSDNQDDNTGHVSFNGSKLQIPSSFSESFEPSVTFQLDQQDNSNEDKEASPFDWNLPQPGNSLYKIETPTVLEPDKLIESFRNLDILKINYHDPFYDKFSDLPSRPFIFANKKITVPCMNESSLPPFSSQDISSQISQEASESFENPSKHAPITASGLTTWIYKLDPPSKLSVANWVEVEESRMRYKRARFKSQIEPGITQTNDYKYSYQSDKVSRNPNSAFVSLTNFYLDLHVNTHDDMLPNPEVHPITMIFYKFDDANDSFNQSDTYMSTLGVLVYIDDDWDDEKKKTTISQLNRIDNSLDNHETTAVELFDSEETMVERLVEIVEMFDPDILSGYEINSSSWGYIVERFRFAYDTNLLFDLSRCKFKSNGKFGDMWGFRHTSAIKINGRHLLNVWRVLKDDLQLTSYSLQNVTYHILHQTLPYYSNLQLSEWAKDGEFQRLLMVVKYYQKKISIALKIMDIQEVILRNVEQSRLIGIDFNSTFYRGSQYKVESILARITKMENIVLNSPSKEQVHDMRPIECIPLILEPDSNFYKSPMVVLDFQSLYPSIMIAYNYCYSTLIGKLNGYKNHKNNIGYLKHHHLPAGLVDLLKFHDGVNISPNGYIFAKSNVKKSILAKMLEEILGTRINIKTMMKVFKEDKELIKLYNSRQLALKLIANVTYGYTSATFSGRMPNPDIADAIVSTGREILSKSIQMIEGGDYGAKVVYGDTDSLFVYFPGKSKQEAFKLGDTIARHITDQFPDPVKLKFEKVYHPCVLLAKKRYVGFSYEYEDQIEPKFDAKGIETVRRDGIPAQQKMTEKTLRILFNTKNLSQVKSYTLDQFHKILLNKVAIKDFCFAKAVRHGTYKNEKYLPPGAVIAQKNVLKDPRSEPQYKERVKYVVIHDVSKARIKDRCLTPEEFIASFKTKNPFSLDYEYYITRVLIPPLERIFNLIGADIRAWYKELPKLANFKQNETDILNVSEFIKFNSCLKCGVQLRSAVDSKHICYNCRKQEVSLMTDVFMTSQINQTKFMALLESCSNCVSTNFLQMGSNKRQFEDSCTNNDCLIYYNKIRTKNAMELAENEKELILEDFEW